jgi:hypothetical protein
MRSLAIIGLCVGSAVIYGILHDQITARICVEYFTIGHTPVFDTADPTLLGIGWGIIATWCAGLLLGIPMAVAARAGKRPKREASSLVAPIAFLLTAMGLCAIVAGFVGWLLSSRGTVFLTGNLASEVPQDKHIPFITDAWAHSASYVVGFVGGLILIASVWRSRGQTSRGAAPERK